MSLGERILRLAAAPRLRVRIKPSWSGRVYGTYSLTARPFLAGSAAVLAGLLLFGRLAALNLAAPGRSAERAALRRCLAHGEAAREVRLPAANAGLERSAEALFGLAYRLKTILGAHEPDATAAGLGRMDGEERGVPGTGSGPRLQDLVADVGLLDQQFDRLGKLLVGQQEELRFTPSIAPIYQADFVPTSGFGPRLSPFTRLPEFHRGQDLAADPRTKIVATADAVVVRVERDARASRMGRYVVLDHGGRYQTYYGHCERVFVEVGDRVERHQIIAEVGSTGRSTGPHVHYEVRLGEQARDPRQFLVFDPRFGGEDGLASD